MPTGYADAALQSGLSIKQVSFSKWCTNLEGKVRIISFARMTPQSRAGWLWIGQRFIMLAGLERLPLTCHHASHR